MALGHDKGKAGMAPGCSHTDSLQMTEDEAIEAVAHHLRLASLFYMNTPEDALVTRAEVLRIIEARDGDIAADPARVWLDATEQFHEEGKERHG